MAILVSIKKSLCTDVPFLPVLKGELQGRLCTQTTLRLNFCFLTNTRIEPYCTRRQRHNIFKIPLSILVTLQLSYDLQISLCSKQSCHKSRPNQIKNALNFQLKFQKFVFALQPGDLFCKKVRLW